MNKLISLLTALFCIFNSNVSSQDKNYTEVPFILSQTGQLLVEARVGNHTTPTYFLIEVSGKNLLRSDQPAVLEKYGLDTMSQSYVLNDIKIGDFSIKKTRFGKSNKLHKRGEISFPPPVIGTLGPTFFKKLAIQFDFKIMKLRIADSVDKLPIPKDAYRVMYRSSFINKSVALNLDTRRFGEREFIVSTRSPLGIHLFQSQLSPGLLSQYSNEIIPYKFSLNGEEDFLFSAYETPEIFVEHELILKNQEIWLSDYMENSIGLGFLMNFVFTIDYKNQMLYFEPSNEAGKNSMSK